MMNAPKNKTQLIKFLRGEYVGNDFMYSKKIERTYKDNREENGKLEVTEPVLATLTVAQTNGLAMHKQGTEGNSWLMWNTPYEKKTKISFNCTDEYFEIIMHEETDYMIYDATFHFEYTTI